MLRDLSYAYRRLVRAPGFTALVALTLGLGIGAVTAIFTLVDAVLLRPLDYPQPDRLVTLWSHSLRAGSRFKVSAPDLADWRAQSRSFAAVASYRHGGTEAVSVEGAAENIRTAAVSGEFFGVLGVPPHRGRAFSGEELRAGGVVVVASSLVQRHFGGDERRALDGTLKVFGRAFRIVGIMPAGFGFPERTEVWLPVDTVFPPALVRSAHNYAALARLAPGVSLAQAQSELDTIAARLRLQHPDSNRDKGARVIPLRELLVTDYQATLWILLGAVGLVLLIACANIANLLLARGAGRVRELAVRAALGASRARVIRQLLAESLLLAMLGGALALLLAHAGLDLLLALAPRRLPGLERVALDRSALLFTAGVSLVVSLLIGLAPALQATRLDLRAGLQTKGIGGRRGGRLRAGLVVGQLALSLLLLVSAGLLLQSLQRLARVDPGHRTERLLVLEANFPGAGETEGRRGLAFFDALAREAGALPGVRAAAFTGSLPVDALNGNGTYWIDGSPATQEAEPRRNALFRAVGPAFFSTAGIPVREGRELDRRDVEGAPRAVVVNEAMARAGWPGRSPLGQRIRIGWFRSTHEWMTIVGVVADTRQVALDRPVSQELYLPALQHPTTGFNLKVVARTEGEPLALAPTLRDRARALDPEVPVIATTAELMVARTLAAPRFRTVLIAAFAGLALVLALIGVAGVIACVASERRPEIGLRLAIGARPDQIVRQLLARALRLAALGVGLGVVASLAGARLLQGLLFGIAPGDPATIAGVSALLLTTALAAAAWPALRAARLSPMTVLRGE